MVGGLASKHSKRAGNGQSEGQKVDRRVKNAVRSSRSIGVRYLVEKILCSRACLSRAGGGQSSLSPLDQPWSFFRKPFSMNSRRPVYTFPHPSSQVLALAGILSFARVVGCLTVAFTLARADAHTVLFGGLARGCGHGAWQIRRAMAANEGRCVF